MRLPCCLCVCVSPIKPESRNDGARRVPLLGKGLINMFPAVARQRIGKHFSAATNTLNNRITVGRGVFFTVRVVSDTKVCPVTRPTWGSNPGLTDRLIVGRNLTLTLTLTCLESRRLVLSRTFLLLFEVRREVARFISVTNIT
jgi:hypothetical protein